MIFENIDQLPKELGVLPIYGAVLMPRAQLPVPILEQRFLQLLSDGLKKERLLGLVQPILAEDEHLQNNEPPLFKAGTLAYITDINVAEENKIFIILTGICRFDIETEIKDSEKPYRIVSVNYNRYQADLVQEADFNFDRDKLLKFLKLYFKNHDISANWQEIEATSNEKLVSALTMLCPFDPREKQAVLELPTLREQS
ncbi:MAG: LON peptidase substrate-binding domain-containing protein, partial [Proteobacteria bacterium]|nr:LON peptidase substrate-binding domain-containing protein [Pseudomonadota bacterium]